MLERIRRHPFAVQAFFRRSLVLTYALPASVLCELIGPGLELDTYDDYGFLAIAMVDARQLRPKGFPSWLGQAFFLTGYRVFTRFVRPGRPTLRGLRILRSDTDRRMMAALGNVFTHYGYRFAQVEVDANETRLAVRIRTPRREADLRVEAELTSRPAPLPDGSPFRCMEDALQFAGPLPFTFDYDAELGKMLVVKGIRKFWRPEPVRVQVHEVTFLAKRPFAEANPRLANAFYLENVPYAWMPGTLESVS